MQNLEDRVRAAIRHFWKTRESQSKNQGSKTGSRDRGSRSAVTGGAQMDGFVSLVKSLLVDGGIPEPAIFCKRGLELPGYYRPEKQWDLLVVADGQLLATIEFKSQVGPSFGNNYNNRTEEALGNATDLWAAYREGAFRTSPKPWLGYVMLLEDTEKSRAPIGVTEPHFTVFEEFRDASYAKRYEILLTKLVRERLYDSACLLLSDRTQGLKSGMYVEPSAELSFQNLATSLLAKAIAHARTRTDG
jgi:Restriction endonuclease XhoI